MTDASTTSRSSSVVCRRAVGADELRDVDVDDDAALVDLVDQPRALDLVEAQAAPQRLDRPSILGDAARASVGRERGIDFRGYVAEMKRGHNVYASDLGADPLAVADLHRPVVPRRQFPYDPGVLQRSAADSGTWSC